MSVFDNKLYGLSITQKCRISKKMADRGIVVGNKIIYAKLKIRENRWMRNRLLSVQATVDNRIPHSFKPGGAFVNPDGSRRVNLKKIQLKKERDRLIHQDNGIMLRSISNIMRHNNMDTWASTRKYVPKMSNYRSRRRNMEYIRWENQILLKRLKNTIPWINNKEIKADFSRQMKHLKHMGEYAYKGGGKKHGSFDKYWRAAVYEARPVRGKGSTRRKLKTYISSEPTSSPPKDRSRHGQHKFMFGRQRISALQGKRYQRQSLHELNRPRTTNY